MAVADSEYGRLDYAAVALVCATLLTGCASTVAGHGVGSAPITARQVSAQLSTLLPEPAQFPARYPAVVLSPEAAAQASEDLSGVAHGASVLPADCAPPPPPQQVGPDAAAVVVGSDDAARATLTVQVTRTDEPLAALRDQVAKCPSVLVSKSGAATTVTTRSQAPPQLDAPDIAPDDTVATRRTVAPEAHGAGLVRTTDSLVGQVGDVRIVVAYMTFADTPPDSAAIDALFVTTVRKVRAA